MELAILFFGITLSIFFTAYVDSVADKFALVVLLTGFILTCALFVLFRRITAQWTVIADAKAWLAQRTWRKLHARQAKYLQFLQRWALWLPSLCAVFVLFFLPAASHVFYAGRQLVRHYRVDTPLNWMIIKSSQDGFVSTFFSNRGAARYGFNPAWLFKRREPSGATFMWSDPQHSEGWWRPERELQSGRSTDVVVRQFQLGTITATCYEYRYMYHYDFETRSYVLNQELLWESLCSTQPNGVDYNLRAAYFGYGEDLPIFYKVLNSARPAN